MSYVPAQIATLADAEQIVEVLLDKPYYAVEFVHEGETHDVTGLRRVDGIRFRHGDDTRLLPAPEAAQYLCDIRESFNTQRDLVRWIKETE